MKSEPTSLVEVLKQLIFSNPLVTNAADHPLGVSGFSEGRAIAEACYIKIKDLWDREDREWKSLLDTMPCEVLWQVLVGLGVEGCFLRCL